MSSRSWVRSLFARPPHAVRPASPRFRPRVEGLEDRVTPATFYVTRSNDDLSAGSLRWAITQANANPGPDTIDNYDRSTNITVQNPINLTLNGTQLPEITGDLTLNGNRDFAVSGDDRSRVLSVGTGVNVQLSGVTIRNGDAKAAGFGGGIFNRGTLVITNSTITNCHADLGGGIYNSGGTLTLTNSVVSGNRAGVAPLVVDQVSNGTAQGGGIYSFQGSVTLDRVTVEGNFAVGGRGGPGADGFAGEGGGLYVSGGLRVVDSTIRGNTAQGGAGGVGTAGTAGTTAVLVPSGSPGGPGGPGGGGGAGGSAAGGGVYVVTTGQATMLRTTVSGNAATGGAGGAGGVGGTGATGGRGRNATADGSGSFLAFPATAGGRGGNGGLGGDGGDGGLVLGGGVYVRTGTVLLTNATVADNRASGGAAGAGGTGGQAGAGGDGGIGLNVVSIYDDRRGGAGGAGGNGGAGGRGGTGGASRGGGLDRAGGLVFGFDATLAYNRAAGGAGGAAGAGGGAGAGGPGGLGYVYVGEVGHITSDPVYAPNGTAGGGGAGGAGGPAGAGSGGGVSAGGLGDTSNRVVLVNTVVALNTAGDGTASDVAGTLDPGGNNNLIGTGGAGGLTHGVNGNLVGVSNPGLGTLANNGGPTQTVALLRGSPAIDAGDNDSALDFTTFQPLTTDQRGGSYPRTVAGRVDIGAYESPFGRDSLVVTTLADESDISSSPALGTGTSLREAIAWANLNPGADTITFAPNLVFVDIILGGTQLPAITGILTIAGPGSPKLGVSGAGTSRVLEVAAWADLTLVGVQIFNGRAAYGGGIFTSGKLTLSDVILSGNTASVDGGGIHNSGTLTVTNGTILSGNSAEFGGGIYNTGTLTVTNGTTLSGNTATQNGGGIFNSGPSLSVTRGSFIGNASVRANGGGLYSHGSATVSVSASTFSGNTADSGGGGGIDFRNGTLIVTDSTFSGNRGNGVIALSDGSTATVTGSTFADNTGGQGGGIANFATLTVRNSTISGNAGRLGGGIFNLGTLTLTNTIVAGNSGSSKDIWGGVGATSANNLIGDANSAGGLIDGQNGNLVGVDPRLGPLADNGGPTKTMALLNGSPALNTGSNALVSSGVTTDQRGQPRLFGPAVDIGAVEDQTTRPTITRQVAQLVANEGATTVTSGNFNSVNGHAAVTLTASVGSVVPFVIFINNVPIMTGAWIWSYVPADNSGSIPVTITATDANGIAASTTFFLTVANVAPTLSNVQIPATGYEGRPFAATVTATDVPADTVTITWTVTGPDGLVRTATGPTAPTFTPTRYGRYTVTLTASDEDGGTTTLTRTFDVLAVVTVFGVQKGHTQRSFVRYADVTLAAGFDAAALLAAGRVRVVRAGLTGTGTEVLPLAGVVIATGSILAFDFGVNGIGGNRGTNAGDGYYSVEVDADGDGTFEVARRFFRLFGDTNGDGKVDVTDVNRVAAGAVAGVAYDANLDINGDGVVNSTDRLLASRAVGRAVGVGFTLDG